MAVKGHLGSFLLEPLPSSAGALGLVQDYGAGFYPRAEQSLGVEIFSDICHCRSKKPLNTHSEHCLIELRTRTASAIDQTTKQLTQLNGIIR